MTNPQLPVPRFHGRAKFGNSEVADVMDTAASETEAVESGGTIWNGSDSIWEEVECKNGELHPIQLRCYLPPAGRAK